MQADANRNSTQLQYFWLCNACCRTLTVVADKGNEVTVAPRRFDELHLEQCSRRLEMEESQ